MSTLTHVCFCFFLYLGPAAFKQTGHSRRLPRHTLRPATCGAATFPGNYMTSFNHLRVSLHYLDWCEKGEKRGISSQLFAWRFLGLNMLKKQVFTVVVPPAVIRRRCRLSTLFPSFFYCLVSYLAQGLLATGSSTLSESAGIIMRSLSPSLEKKKKNEVD